MSGWLVRSASYLVTCRIPTIGCAGGGPPTPDRAGCYVQAESGVAAKWEACKAASTADAVDAPTYAEASVTLITVRPPPCLLAAWRRPAQLQPRVCRRRQVFDVIGTAMSIPKNDMMGNATAVQKFAAENPGKTLQELCDAEIAEAGGDAEKAIKKEGCTVKLLWLSRAMKFIQARRTPVREASAASDHRAARRTPRDPCRDGSAC